MVPRPQDMSMNQQRRDDSTRSGMSESEYLAAAAAAKPKDESLYESLLRYHEEEDPRDSMSSLRKVSYDEEDDRKLPAKPTPIRQRSFSDNDYTMSPSALRRRDAMRTNQGDESAAWKQDDSFAEPSLYPKFTAPTHHHPTSREEPLESTTSHKLRHEQAHPDSALSEHFLPAAFTTASSRAHPAPHKQSSFYKSALEASKTERHSSLFANELIEDEKLARELARDLDEKLAAQEQAKRIEAEDAKLARELDKKLAQELARKLEMEDGALPNYVAADADPGQLKIMQAIREDRERKELEKALQHSGGTGLGLGSNSDLYTAPDAPGTTAPARVDYLLSQQLALQEWQKAPRDPTPRNRSPNPRNRSPMPPVPRHTSHLPPIRRHHSTGPNHSTGDRHGPHRVSFEHYTPHSSDEAELHDNPEEDRLLQQGNMETREAIADGRAHVVQCLGCLGRLHAPMSYALVYCPKCHTVSPAQTFVARDDRASIRRGRSRRL